MKKKEIAHNWWDKTESEWTKTEFQSTLFSGMITKWIDMPKNLTSYDIYKFFLAIVCCGRSVWRHDGLPAWRRNGWSRRSIAVARWDGSRIKHLPRKPCKRDEA